MNKVFKKHGFLMILGCLVPIFALGLIAFFGVSQKSLFILLALACPFGHIFLMKGHKNHDH